MQAIDVTTCSAADEHVASEQAPASAHLRLLWSTDPAKLGRRFDIGDDLLRIGRDTELDGLQLDDPRLSRVHARIGYDARCAAVRIGDAQSRNGTFVNAQRIETAVLCAGDVVRVGDTVFLYEEHDRMALLRARARAAAPLETSVLIRGETGTGKELMARALHAQSGRSGRLIALNCASVPLELLGAELFGHTKQAFSGAAHARSGLFADAANGTLFLDEIGDCPLPVQAALLRVLQEKAVRPIGAERELPVDVRVIAATNADLTQAIAAGTFRADLYARLAPVTLHVPPLRARKAELIALMQGFAQEQGCALELTADAAEALLCWHWPLNMRELQGVVQTARVNGALPGTLGLDALHEAFPHIAQPLLARRSNGATTSASSRPSAAPSPHSQVRALLEAHDGNVSAVAQALGKPRAQVYRWLKAMGLRASKFRK